MALRRVIQWLRLIPLAAWILIQIAMTGAFSGPEASAAPTGDPPGAAQKAAELAAIKRALPDAQIVLCGPWGALQSDEGDAPAAPVFHGCDWCQGFSKTVPPQPACLPAPRMAITAADPSAWPDPAGSTEPTHGFSSRAPPAADLTKSTV